MSGLIFPTDKLHGDRPSAASVQGLADSKELTAFAFERTRMPIVISDARQYDFPIVLANGSFLELTGYSAEDVVGRNCRFLQGPATSPMAVAEIRKGLLQGKTTDVEILNYRKDGTTFWNRLHISPIHDDDGDLVYFFASQIDVTEFRKIHALEASEHRLLKEVDHRSKNALAIVESIVRLSDARDPRVYAASIQRRIQALSHVHGMFADRGWQYIAVEDVVRLMVSAYPKEKATFTGPDVRLSPVALQPLGLVFHELASNAAAHGALGDSRGTVEVAWDIQGSSLTIIWREHRPRPMSRANRTGFGTIMIDTMIERQLNGRIQREWTDTGLNVAICLPGLVQARGLNGYT